MTLLAPYLFSYTSQFFIDYALFLFSIRHFLFVTNFIIFLLQLVHFVFFLCSTNPIVFYLAQTVRFFGINCTCFSLTHILVSSFFGTNHICKITKRRQCFNNIKHYKYKYCTSILFNSFIDFFCFSGDLCICLRQNCSQFEDRFPTQLR